MTNEWLAQRISAVALVLLTLWFGYSLFTLEDFTHVIVLTWLSQPLNTILMLLYVMTMIYHADLGMRVIIEDYISCLGLRLTCIILVKFVFAFTAVTGIWAILKVAYDKGI